jgi:hypothetical protein
MGRSISLGMLNILGEDPSQWSYLPQTNSPNQNWHNLCKDDGGACGPFVYKMTQMLITLIKRVQLQGHEHECNLEIDWAFASHVFHPQFHSGNVRRKIQARILRRYHMSQASALADQHDYYAIQDADVVLEDGPVVTFEIPSHQQPPVLHMTQPEHRHARTKYTGRPCNSGTNYHNPVDMDMDDSDSDSDSTEGSSGGDTVIIGQEALWEDIVMGNNDIYYDDGEGGTAVIDQPNSAQNEDMSTESRGSVNSSPEPTEEERVVNVMTSD